MMDASSLCIYDKINNTHLTLIFDICYFRLFCIDLTHNNRGTFCQ